MNRKVIILISLGSVAILTALLIYHFVYNKPHKDYAGAEAEFFMTPAELFNAFNQTGDEAVKRYNGKIIALTGTPDAFETVDNLTIAVFHLDEGMFGPRGIRCTFLEKLPDDQMRSGEEITLKGFCSGYNDEDVILEKCTLMNL